MSKPTNSIRLGIDLGSMLFRVAYVHPEDEQAVVTVPISIDEFRPCFPIAERLPVNEMYVSRFFPSLIQRIDRDFELTLQGATRTTRQLLTDLVLRTVQAAREFSAREVEGIVLSGPMWLSTEARAAVRAAAAGTGVAHVDVCTDAQSLAAWSRAEPGMGDGSETMLFFVAGYTGLGVALARSTPRGARVLARNGQQGMLAGNCLDFSIMQGAYHVLRQNRVVPTETPEVTPWSELQQVVQDAKELVAEGRDAEFAFPHALAAGAGRSRMCIDAASFSRLVETQMAGAQSLVNEVLEDVGVQPSEVRQVLLTGGTTHIPLIRERLAASFPRAKVRHLPTEAVAFGAARLARQNLVDVADTGVDAPAGFFYPAPGVEPSLVRLAAGQMAPTSPAAPEMPGLAAQVPGPTQAAAASDGGDSIDQTTIASILRSADRTALQAVVVRLRALEEAAAQERAKLERMLQGDPSKHN